MYHVLSLSDGLIQLGHLNMFKQTNRALVITLLCLYLKFVDANEISGSAGKYPGEGYVITYSGMQQNDNLVSINGNNFESAH